MVEFQPRFQIRCHNEADILTAQVDIEQLRFKSTPLVLGQGIYVGKCHQNDWLRMQNHSLFILLITHLKAVYRVRRFKLWVLVSMFLDHHHLLLESSMRIDFLHILQDDDLAELVVPIEVVTDLFNESRLSDMIDSLDVDQWVRINAIIECLNSLVQLNLPTNI